MLKTLIKMLRDERGFVITASVLAGTAIGAAVGAGSAAAIAGGVLGAGAGVAAGLGIKSAVGKDKGSEGSSGAGGEQGSQGAPQVGSGSQDISREEMRKRGRAALIGTSSQGVLGNATTGRSQLLGN